MARPNILETVPETKSYPYFGLKMIKMSREPLDVHPNEEPLLKEVEAQIDQKVRKLQR